MPFRKANVHVHVCTCTYSSIVWLYSQMRLHVKILPTVHVHTCKCGYMYMYVITVMVDEPLEVSPRVSAPTPADRGVRRSLLAVTGEPIELVVGVESPKRIK